jgi:hypothetical protein
MVEEQLNEQQSLEIIMQIVNKVKEKDTEMEAALHRLFQVKF